MPLAATSREMNWRDFEFFLLRIRSEPRLSTYKTHISNAVTDENYPPDLLSRCTRDLPPIYGRLLSHHLPAKTGHSTFTAKKASPVKIPLPEDGWKRVVEEFLHVALGYVTPFDLLRKLFDFTDTHDIVSQYINVLLEPILEENELYIHDNVPITSDDVTDTMIPDSLMITDRKTGETLGVIETKSAGSVVKASVTQCMQQLLELRRKELKETKRSGPLFGIVTDALHFIFIKLHPGGQFEFEQNKCGQLKVHKANTWDDLDEIAAMINGLCQLRNRKNAYHNRRPTNEESQLFTRKRNSPLEEINLSNIQAGLRREYGHGYRTISPDGVQDDQVPVDGTEYNKVPYNSTASESDDELLQVSKENVAAEDIHQVLKEKTQVVDQNVPKQSLPAEDLHENVLAKVEKDQHVSRSYIVAATTEDYPAYKEKRPENAFDHDDTASKHNATNSHNDSGYNSKSNITYNQDESIKHSSAYDHDGSVSGIQHNTAYDDDDDEDDDDDSVSCIKHSCTYNHDGSASGTKHITDHNDTAFSSVWNDVSKLSDNRSLSLNNATAAYTYDAIDSSTTWRRNIDYTQDKPVSMPTQTSLGFSPGDYIPSKAGIPEQYSPHKINGMYACAVKGCYQAEQYLNTMYTHIRRYHTAPLRCVPCGNLYYSADGIKKHMKTVHDDGVSRSVQGSTSNNYEEISGRIPSSFNNYNEISALISISHLVSTPVKPTALASMILSEFSPGDYIHTKAGISSTPQKAGGMYYCPHCSHAEKYLNTLYTHIRKQHEGSLVCGVCGRQYNSAQGLKQHMKNKH